MNKICQKIQTLLSLYTENALEDIQRQEVISHLDNCNDCKKQLKMLEKTIKSLHNLKKIEAPNDFLVKVQAATSAKPIKQKLKELVFFPFYIKSITPYASILAVFILVVFLKKSNLHQKVNYDSIVDIRKESIINASKLSESNESSSYILEKNSNPMKDISEIVKTTPSAVKDYSLEASKKAKTAQHLPVQKRKRAALKLSKRHIQKPPLEMEGSPKRDLQDMQLTNSMKTISNSSPKNLQKNKLGGTVTKKESVFSRATIEQPLESKNIEINITKKLSKTTKKTSPAAEKVKIISDEKRKPESLSYFSEKDEITGLNHIDQLRDEEIREEEVEQNKHFSIKDHVFEKLQKNIILINGTIIKRTDLSGKKQLIEIEIDSSKYEDFYHNIKKLGTITTPYQLPNKKTGKKIRLSVIINYK